MRRAAALAVALLSLLPGASWAARDEVFALVGGRVMTVSGPILETGTIVIRDGVIEAVGAQVSVPPDARVIDAKGLILTPGLIDGFGGVGLPSAPRAAGAGGGGGGGGGARAAAPSTTDPLSPQTIVLEKVRAAEALKARDMGVTTALAVPSGGVLPGQSVLLNLSGESAEGMALRQPAALHLHMATLGRQYPGSIMGTVAYVRQALYDAARYREEWAAWEHAPRGKKRPRYDAALAAWQPVLAGTLPLVVTARLEGDLRRALVFADEFKVKVIVAGATRAYRVADVVKTRKVPLLVSVNFDPPRAANLFRGGADDEKERQEIDEAERNPAELNKAGISFALVSGHAENFVRGVQKAIERGLPRDVALRAVTLTAAEILGVADRTGSIEVGKIGNVVAWSAEPLTKDAKPKLVFVDGQLYEPEERPERKDDKGGDKGEDKKPGEQMSLGEEDPR
jgi:imidazolonepropionase-like amidohydrolase